MLRPAEEGGDLAELLQLPLRLLPAAPPRAHRAARRLLADVQRSRAARAATERAAFGGMFERGGAARPHLPDARAVTVQPLRSDDAATASSPSAGARGKTTSGQRKRVRWTESEEGQLRAGVGQLGEGAWAKILKEFTFDACRSSVDLTDKWRNIYK